MVCALGYLTSAGDNAERGSLVINIHRVVKHLNISQRGVFLLLFIRVQHSTLRELSTL